LVRISTFPARVKTGARSICDALSSRHQLHQQHRQAEAVGVAAGLDGKRRDEDLFIASLTIAEIRRGILEKPRGKKRDALAMAIRPQVAAL